MHPRPELMQDESSGTDGRKYNEWMANRANSRQKAREAVELLKNSGVSEAFLHGQATSPSTSAEKRLEGLLGALKGYREGLHFTHGLVVRTDKIVDGLFQLIKEYEKS